MIGLTSTRRRLVAHAGDRQARFQHPENRIRFQAREATRTMKDIDRIQVGRCFVSEKKGLIREITSETVDGMVHWRSYDLFDGRSTGDSLMCSKEHICRWADREATEEEKASLERDALTIKERTELSMISYALANVPDQRLIDEIRRRGYDVVRRENTGAGMKGTRT
jgi:hypothetical protein